jgi:abortive infection bacteriophage resistance protein
MRYTKQAMTLAQQIQTLQGRGLMIADTNKAEQALDAISYFRLADYWYHLEATIILISSFPTVILKRY